jgi:ribosome biogenesis GTPase
VAKQKKLSKGQSRRIKANHQKRLSNADKKPAKVGAQEWQTDNLGQVENAIVISRFGQHADVETQNGDVLAVIFAVPYRI